MLQSLAQRCSYRAVRQMEGPNVDQKRERWTNESVRRLAGRDDPVAAVTRRARAAVMEALDRGWAGPPFDPIELAKLRGIEVVGKEAIRDARTVADDSGRLRIEVNPNRPRPRVRFSVAHELGHTLFPDCAQHVRNRATYHELATDEWQLEALCNIAAAEFLMPTGSFPELRQEDVGIERLLELRLTYGVSSEAVLIRTVRLSAEPMAMFCASKIEMGPNDGSYRIDYSIESPAQSVILRPGVLLPRSTLVAGCTAIGYTAKGSETWQHHKLSFECVGVPAYPGSLWPRVVGLARMVDSSLELATPGISYLRGDALGIRGNGPTIIAHIVNDATPNWGGRGFAQAVRQQLPAVQSDFQEWVRLHRSSFRLGEGRLCKTSPTVWIFSMICQEGYGKSEGPKLRYGPLQKCLVQLAQYARAKAASVQMPRIGTGHAGGAWEIIEELVRQEVCEQGVRVTVFALPVPAEQVAIPRAR